MVSLTSLLPTLLLALAVSANPIVVNDNFIRLPFAKKFNITTKGHIPKSDQARVAALRSRALSRGPGKLTKDEVVDVDVTNQAMLPIRIPRLTPGTWSNSYHDASNKDSLLVDMGFTNTWVGSGKPFVRTSSTAQTNDEVAASFGTTSSFSGVEFTDTVMLGCGLNVTKQSIGVAFASQGFDGFDGAFGLGPTVLTEGTLIPDTHSTVPTVTDNLFSQGVIDANQFAIYFEPIVENQGVITNGELTFGGPADSSKFIAPISFAPITTVSPANDFWGINQSIRYGPITTILPLSAGIIDTGTLLLRLSTDAFNVYKQVTGAVLDSVTGLLRLTSAQFANLQSLFFTINGITYEFNANAQAWPRLLNSVIGGTAGNVYLIVGNLGSEFGEGIDFINGIVWLERYYTLYDSTNKRIGIANTPSTFATTN